MVKKILEDGKLHRLYQRATFTRVREQPGDGLLYAKLETKIFSDDAAELLYDCAASLELMKHQEELYVETPHRTE